MASDDRPPAVILQDIEARAEDEDSALEHSDILALVANLGMEVDSDE